MPSTDQPDTNQLPVVHDAASRADDASDTGRLESLTGTLSDREVCRQLVDCSRVTSVLSVGSVILITYLATLGRGVETNPVTRALIEYGWGVAALVSIGTTALVYELYARLVTGYRESRAVALTAAGAGTLLAVFNVANLVNDLRVLYVVGLPETVPPMQFLWLSTVVLGLSLAGTADSRLEHVELPRVLEWGSGAESNGSPTRDPGAD